MAFSESDWRSDDEKGGMRGNREILGSLSSGEIKRRELGGKEEEEREVGEKQLFN